MTGTTHAIACDEAFRDEPPSLEALIEQAQGYGRVWLSESTTRQRPAWHASITFQTEPGIDLEAESRFDHSTPAEALQLAIERAEKIKGQFR